MIALVLALALAASPRLDVTSASLAIPEGAPVGHLHLVATFTGIPVDPNGGFVELTVGGSTRFANLRPAPGDPRLGVSSAEHDYGLRVDLAAGRLRAAETDVTPPGSGPLRIEFGAHGVRACTLVWLRRTGGSWRFNGRRDRQRPCPAAPPARGR